MNKLDKSIINDKIDKISNDNDNDRDKDSSKTDYYNSNFPFPEFDDYYIIYETTKDYKSKKPEMIIKLLHINNLSLKNINNLINDSKKIVSIYISKENINEDKDKSQSEFKICIALVKCGKVQIISIDKLNPIVI